MWGDLGNNRRPQRAYARTDVRRLLRSGFEMILIRRANDFEHAACLKTISRQLLSTSPTNRRSVILGHPNRSKGGEHFKGLHEHDRSGSLSPIQELCTRCIFEAFEEIFIILSSDQEQQFGGCGK